MPGTCAFGAGPRASSARASSRLSRDCPGTPGAAMMAMAPMALGSTATCKGDGPCRKAGTRQTRRTGRQPKQGTRACDVPALQAPQGSHKGHDVPACRADAVSCPFGWRPSCAVGVCEGLVCRTERGSGPGHFRPDVRPRCLVGPFDRTFGQIFGQPLSPSCGPARHWASCWSQSFGQPLRAGRQEGQDGAERTGLGMNLVPEQAQGAGSWAHGSRDG